MEAAKNICIILAVALLIWMMVSWADVLASGLSQDPHAWNIFVVLTESLE